MDVATYDGADVGFGLIGGYWRFELQYLINYWYGFTPAPTAAPTIVVPSVNPVTDDACACQNGCTCEPSCKDENNYYCKPQGKKNNEIKHEIIYNSRFPVHR